MGRLITGMAAGAVIGTAVSMAVMPQLNRRTRKSMKRAGRRMIHVAEGTVGNIMSKM